MEGAVEIEERMEAGADEPYPARKWEENMFKWKAMILHVAFYLLDHTSNVFTARLLLVLHGFAGWSSIEAD